MWRQMDCLATPTPTHLGIPGGYVLTGTQLRRRAGDCSSVASEDVLIRYELIHMNTSRINKLVNVS